MISIRPLAVLLMGVASLGACDRAATEPVQPVSQETPAAPAAPPGPSISYACESGETVQAQYADTETAHVTYRGQTYAMRIAISGSGARYVGSGLEWWTASRNGQETATLSRIGPNDQVGTAILERCSRPSANPDLPPPGQPAAPEGVAAPACRAQDLRLEQGASDAGVGNRIQILTLTNAGDRPCSVSGYPSVSLLDEQGRAVTSVRSDQNPGSALPVVLAKDAPAFFDIAWNVNPDAADGQTVCPAVTRIRVRLGADPAALSLPLSLTPCGGRIRLSPIRSTEDAIPTSP